MSGDAQKTQTELLASVCECGIDQAAAIEVTLRMAVMLPREALERAVQNIERAHTLGPVLDPTRYRDALQRGNLERTKKTMAALHALVSVLQEVERTAAAEKAEADACTAAFREGKIK